MTGSEAIGRLPHGGTARWITEVVEAGEEHIVCRGAISPASPFAAAGVVSPFAGIELAAQATAVLEILSRQAGEGGAGYLVRVRGMELKPVGLPAGVPITVRARRTEQSLPLCIYDVAVLLDDEVLLRGTLGTFVEI